MKPGDTIQIRQNDLVKKLDSDSLEPTSFWIYATVHEVLDDGAFVEVNHPANIEHAARKKVLTKDLRTLDQLQAVAALHPDRELDKLDFRNGAHRELNEVRAAIERMKPAEEAAV